jgi:hypothetical protein
MMTLYIAGKVTGDPVYRQKFLDAEGRLSAVGYNPVNPTAFIPARATWKLAMRQALSEMLKCGGIALLPDWRRSKGARLERRIAKKLGIPCASLEQWIGWMK